MSCFTLKLLAKVSLLAGVLLAIAAVSRSAVFADETNSVAPPARPLNVDPPRAKILPTASSPLARACGGGSSRPP